VAGMKAYRGAVAVEAIAAASQSLWQQSGHCDVTLERDFTDIDCDTTLKRCTWLQFAYELCAGARFVVTICVCLGSGMVQDAGIIKSSPSCRC
jgi:hypothetical protein